MSEDIESLAAQAGRAGDPVRGASIPMTTKAQVQRRDALRARAQAELARRKNRSA